MTRARWTAAIVLSATVLVALRIVDPSAQVEQADTSGVHATGFGEVRFESRDGKPLTALVYRSSRFDPEAGPIWFVMHGASRAAERYVRTAAPAAERHGALAITIRFPRALYPNGSDYTLGVTTSGSADGAAWEEGRWRAPDAYVYSEVEHAFEVVRLALGGRQAGYYLFGHSAGAQFAHRLMTFVPEARVIRAVAANAGWYTLPAGGPDRNRTMPYGLHGSPVDSLDLGRFFVSPFVVLLGERDTTTAANDGLVRGTPEAMAQGRTRFERGHFYFATAQAEARAIGTDFGWRLAVAPRAGHDAAEVIDSAAYFLFGPDEPPCVATPAAEAGGLMISEVLADPPQGEGGDANGDGERDPSDDEFVEIVNAGPTPVCMAGWALGDLADPERHVFPLDRPLAPGEALVVFGGGVPTGDFGGARVQRSLFAGELDLSNDGDVLTLRDADDVVVREFSWGDCGGGRCAAEHWPGNLGVSGAVARRPEPAGEWSLHAGKAGTRFSPGVKLDGSNWQPENGEQHDGTNRNRRAGSGGASA